MYGIPVLCVTGLSASRLTILGHPCQILSSRCATVCIIVYAHLAVRHGLQPICDCVRLTPLYTRSLETRTEESRTSSGFIGAVVWVRGTDQWRCQTAAGILCCGVSVGGGSRASTVRWLFAVVCVMFRCGGCLLVSQVINGCRSGVMIYQTGLYFINSGCTYSYATYLVKWWMIIFMLWKDS